MSQARHVVPKRPARYGDAVVESIRELEIRVRTGALGHGRLWDATVKILPEFLRILPGNGCAGLVVAARASCLLGLSAGREAVLQDRAWSFRITEYA